MNIPKIFESEYRFSCIVWEYEPIKTRELVRLCTEHLEWKRTTTYTVLKRLCDRGIFKTENSVVTSVIPRREIQCYESIQFVKRTFNGSLAQFITSFLRDEKLSEEEAAEIIKIIKSSLRETDIS